MATEARVLHDGWQVAATAPDRCPDAGAADALEWRDVAAGLAGGLTAALATGGADRDYDAEDWWFRVVVGEPAPGPGTESALRLRGIATVWEAWIDGRPVAAAHSMYAAIEVPLPGGAGELVVCCRALAPRLAGRRRPRARWRTRVVDHPNLRFFRTMLMGRAPGFAAGPAVVGPWRGVEIVRRRGLVTEAVTVRPRLDDDDGIVAASGRVRVIGPEPAPASVVVENAGRTAVARVAADGMFAADLRIPEVARWWPHTHGEPVRHRVTVRAGDSILHSGLVGFRDLVWPASPGSDGLALVVNGVPVFCRGAVWTPWSLADPDPGATALRPVLEELAAAGLNMVRVPGTACWESAAFHDLCDELGLLVWQDCMFANLDYPESDPDFMATVRAEVAGELRALAGRPSLAVVCGGSEVAQQAAMLGLDITPEDGPLYGELLPGLLAAAGIDAAYLPSAPCGGAPPFRPDRGVANYFGVGAYRRPLDDARRAGVRFASECLAFANVGDGEPPPGGVFGAAWKAGVPRDSGAGWDFDDVRDHYLDAVFGIDPAAMRAVDPDRYLALSREVTGVVMAETFGEWRRGGSPCAGGIVLWARDLVDGPGWGLIDAGGRPKAALHHLRRALAPLAVWTTDEGLSGYAIHVGNDGSEPFAGALRVSLYRGATRVEEATAPVELASNGTTTVDAESVLGHFSDIGWAYRFGPPVADLVVVSLLDADGALRSQAVRFPAGRPLEVIGASELGLVAVAGEAGDAGAVLTLAAERPALGVRIDVPGWTPADDAFTLEPGRAREVVLRPRSELPSAPAGTVTALNARGPVAIAAVSG